MALQAFRVAIAIRLGWGGLRFLCYTLELPEILFNSVALEFSAQEPFNCCVYVLHVWFDRQTVFEPRQCHNYIGHGYICHNYMRSFEPRQCHLQELWAKAG